MQQYGVYTIMVYDFAEATGLPALFLLAAYYYDWRKRPSSAREARCIAIIWEMLLIYGKVTDDIAGKPAAGAGYVAGIVFIFVWAIFGEVIQAMRKPPRADQP